MLSEKADGKMAKYKTIREQTKKRQSAFKQKQREAGKVQVTLWVPADRVDELKATVAGYVKTP